MVSGAIGQASKSPVTGHSPEVLTPNSAGAHLDRT